MSDIRIYIFAAVIYLAVINIIAAVMTVRDKKLAKTEGARRIPEKNLFIASLLGGAPAMLYTMKKIRHKTKHKRFMIGIPLIMVLHIACIGLAVRIYISKAA